MHPTEEALNIQNNQEDSEDTDCAMDPDWSERETLLPPQSNNSNNNGSLYKEPQDRFRVVYSIFLFLGVATLLPWNFFITAKQYFDYKFRNTSLPDGVPYNTDNTTTTLQTNFESYLSISAMVANLIFITLAMLLVRNISLTSRLMASLIPIILIFAMTVFLVHVNTDSWQFGFFWLTLSTASFMVGLTAVFTGSIFGLSCLFPPAYTGAVMSGQAVGGALSAVVMIIAIAIGGDPKSSAFGFFLTAAVCSALALAAYFSLYRIKFSKFYMSNQVTGPKVQAINTDEPQDVDKNVYEVNVEIPHARNLESKGQFFTSIMKKIWPYFLSVSLTYFTTLSCFPAVVSLIKSVDFEAGDSWTDTYFSPVVCFLVFNTCDLIGRTAPNWIRVPRNGQPGLLIILSILRMGLLPLFMVCNIHPEHRRYLPVVLKKDAWPISLNTILGLSNGYLGTLSMLYGPSNVDMDQAEGAGMLMTLGMVVGLAAGSVFSLLLVSLI